MLLIKVCESKAMKLGEEEKEAEKLKSLLLWSKGVGSRQHYLCISGVVCIGKCSMVFKL